jgi:integrase
MANIKLTIRTDKKSLNKRLESIIFLRYTHKSKVTYISTKRTIKPEYWDKKNNKIKAGYAGFSSFNLYLEKFKSRIEDIVHKALAEEIDPTVAYLKEQLNQKAEQKEKQTQQLDFFSFAEEFMKNSKINKKASTIKGYKSTVQCFKDFEKYSGQKLTWEIFDMNFYDKFRSYTLEVKDYCNNTHGHKIKTLKTILNEAIEKGYKVNMGFQSKNFKVLSEDADNIYLNEDELKLIMDFNLSDNPKLEKVRDLFIVGCYTGLRFSDFSSIQPEQIYHDGFLRIRTTKTDQNVVIPLHPIVKKIMEKYAGKYPNSLPPALSNQKMNDYLKAIGKLVELNENIIITTTKGSERIETIYKKYELICTHSARRSFCSNIFKQGFSAINIMRISGHKSERAFRKYIKLSEEESAIMLKDHWKNYYADKTTTLKVA